MGLNFRAIILAFSFGVTFQAHAYETSDPGYLTISSVKLEEVPDDFPGIVDLNTIYERTLVSQVTDPNDPIGSVGGVISVGKDLVALGEDIYRLVIKGKPSNATKYAPISVIPAIRGEPVDILDTESWSTPRRHTYRLTWKNLYGMEVVKFQYSVVYSYNGSYNGAGSYLTAVQIIPDFVNTLFGFDFTATMKLGGIVNQGTKANPIAGATLLMEYTISSIMVAMNNTDTFFVNGRGAFKKY